ncbi:MAG TPA: hypothetical protein VMS45_04420 [Gemmatimonadaceae bacterium]|jgi:hypothetical protein|nr:hypothetical protein [Gemmatimonadaceae bacterium]
MRSLFAAVAAIGAAAMTVPAGYTAVPDSGSADMSQAVYTASGANWDVTTGPAHILFADKDAATGVYAAQTTIQQLAKPRHPEAYGLFIGGSNLSDPAKRSYTYFEVRGTGEYLVKVMNGSQTTTISDWKASADIPKQDDAGKATYALKVHVAPNAMHFYVNGKMIAEIPKTASTPTDGIYGLRINHNLHLLVTPISSPK